MSTASSRLTRKPVRITITVPESVYDGLLQVSDNQGRSLSNLASHLLEAALPDRQYEVRAVAKEPGRLGRQRSPWH